jgi:hypothetical protein
LFSSTDPILTPLRPRFPEPFLDPYSLIYACCLPLHFWGLLFYNCTFCVAYLHLILFQVGYAFTEGNGPSTSFCFLHAYCILHSRQKRNLFFPLFFFLFSFSVFEYLSCIKVGEEQRTVLVNQTDQLLLSYSTLEIKDSSKRSSPSKDSAQDLAPFLALGDSRFYLGLQ